MPAQPTTDTALRILDVAERLVQTRGFNAFSYADVADALGVTKASLHYHFPSKAKLGEHLVERYRTSFMAALAAIEAGGGDAARQIAAYVGLYRDVLASGRMCLCGMLAADQDTLPPAMRGGVRRFFDANEAWLAAVLARGRRAGQVRFTGAPADAAALLVAALEGAMLLARARGDTTRFNATAARVLADLGITARAVRRPAAS